MTFEAPRVLLALGVLPVLVALYVLHQRRRRGVSARFTNPSLLPNLVDRAPAWRRHVPSAVLAVALAAMLVGAARPHATVSVAREDATVVLAIDVSASMTAKDVSPSRLAAARSAARAFLDKVPEKFRVGLVSFATRAVVAVPPTESHETVEAALARLRPGEGTALGDAVRLSVRVGRGPAASDGSPAPAAVLLLSDGAASVGIQPAAAARQARSLRTPVYTVALGTPDGVVERPIPGGFREVIRVPPDPETLREVARTSGGQFFAAADDERLKRVYEQLGSRLGHRKERREISDLFAAGAGVLLLAGGALSSLWFRRLP